MPLLLSAVKSQIEYRLNIPTGQFIPEWKNLKTWIYNRCWEEEIPRKIVKKDAAEEAKELIEKEKHENQGR